VDRFVKNFKNKKKHHVDICLRRRHCGFFH